jgi:hypothetical protein
MTMRRALFIFAAVLASASAAISQTTRPDPQAAEVSLRRAETSDNSRSPYRRAILEVKYDPSDSDVKHGVIRRIAIRSINGGPTMLASVTIPPGTPKQDVDVLLPAMSAHDSYNVRLSGSQTADTAPIAEFVLQLEWPAEAVSIDAFLDPDQYEEGDYLPPIWPPRTLKTIFASVLGACVLLSACLFVKPGRRRLLVSGVTLIAAIAGISLLASSEPVVIDTELGADGRLLLVSCLRDTTYEIPSPSAVPLYRDTDEMAADRAVIHQADKLIVEMKTGQVRLFARDLNAANRPTTRAAENRSGI